MFSRGSPKDDNRGGDRELQELKREDSSLNMSIGSMKSEIGGSSIVEGDVFWTEERIEMFTSKF